MIERKKTAQEMAEWMAELADDFNTRWIGTYILDENHQPVKADTMTWARWCETADRRVALTYTEHYEISTVFLGVDHSWSNEGPPIVFETMIFAKNVVSIKGGGTAGIEEDMDRYATWDEALKGHEEMVRRAIQHEQKSPE